MTDSDAARAGFLGLICASPDDDTVRLVFADWLDEQGQGSHAECIRRGVEEPDRFTFAEGLPARVSFATERPDLGGRVDVVLAPEHPGVSWTTYKGAIERATCAWEVWREFGDHLWDRFRFPCAELTTLPPPGPYGYVYLRYNRAARCVEFRVADRQVELPEADIVQVAADPLLDVRRMNEQTTKLLARRWPGVTFTLPG